MADEVQITTPIGHSFLAPIRVNRAVTRARGVAAYAAVGRSLSNFYQLLSPEAAAGGDTPPAPTTDSHERLSPLTAATLNEMHGVEAELMGRAMIEAAKSDGRIDPEERRRILTFLKDSGLPDSDRQALLASLTTPPNPAALAASATTPELATDVYNASLLVLGGHPDGQRYLDGLAQRLGLSADAVAAMQARFDNPMSLTV